jgi:hypothetical protein
MENLQKSLAELIDETLAEIEQLKKSDRYSASEISLADEKANGKMETSAVKKADDEDEDEEDKAEKSDHDEDEDDEDSMEKAEMDCKKADEAYAKAMKKADMYKAEADHKKKMFAMKKGEDKKDEAKEDDEEKELKKSIDARVAPLEAKISDVLAAVKKLAEAPVAARGSSYKNIQPLVKSTDVEQLSKAEVSHKLFELKKSGVAVPTEEFFKLEDGSATPNELATKYGIK